MASRDPTFVPAQKTATINVNAKVGRSQLALRAAFGHSGLLISVTRNRGFQIRRPQADRVDLFLSVTVFIIAPLECSVTIRIIAVQPKIGQEYRGFCATHRNLERFVVNAEGNKAYDVQIPHLNPGISFTIR